MAGRSISISLGLLGVGILWFNLVKNQSEIHADLAGGLTFLGSPEERLPSIPAAERLSFAIVNMPGGRTFGIFSLADRVNKFHEPPLGVQTGTTLAMKIISLVLPNTNNAL
jgi:hypothetical protein